MNDRSSEGTCEDALESAEDSLLEFEACAEFELGVVPGCGLAILTNFVNGFGMSG